MTASANGTVRTARSAKARTLKIGQRLDVRGIALADGTFKALSVDRAGVSYFLVDHSGAEAAASARRRDTKSLKIERADARIRTADPFITSDGQGGQPVPASPSRPHKQAAPSDSEGQRGAREGVTVFGWCSGGTGFLYSLVAPSQARALSPMQDRHHLSSTDQ